MVEPIVLGPAGIVPLGWSSTILLWTTSTSEKLLDRSQAKFWTEIAGRFLEPESAKLCYK